ncbi:PTS sugar transporter subunit IIA [Marinivivus vitaminiproducens]|uniref:PTS sugar transporter subunit IIA n=1 Tax=Marinivivus vitaminiproducens TaxID=3035935 RepID=UPI00279CEB98|nr:PTS sugar transporter subunit IIA [Geminicoccaceae bacterium SCSIO 64248]
MFNLTTILTPEHVVLDVEAHSKRSLLLDLAGRLSGDEGEARLIYQALMERERLGSTGVGKGVAIPHAAIPGLDGLVALFARVRPAIEFDAVDDGPVDLVFLLLAPETGGSDHLKALARVARLLHTPETADRLRHLQDPAEVYAILAGRQSSSHAA